MHVLMPDATWAGAIVAKRGIERAGHTVETCEPDPRNRCAALRGHRCPLDTSPVDMVVLIRTAASPDRLPGEDGALCGVRRRIPLVVAGSAVGSPYSAIATVEDETDDVLTSVETVARLPLPDHTVAASVALHECLARLGVSDPRSHVRVYRRNGGLYARLHFESERPAPGVVSAAAVRVVGVLRDLDPWASGIDVSVA